MPKKGYYRIRCECGILIPPQPGQNYTNGSNGCPRCDAIPPPRVTAANGGSNRRAERGDYALSATVRAASHRFFASRGLPIHSPSDFHKNTTPLDD